MSITRRHCLSTLSGGLLLNYGLNALAFPDQGARPPGTHEDHTDGKTWIQRLERPEELPGLKIDQVIARLRLKPGCVVADIGAATGAFSIPFAKAVGPSGKLFYVDIWPELLDYVGKKAAQQGVTNLQTVLAKPDDPNLPRNRVDLAFFHDVFHNMNDRQAYLSNLVSELKTTGRIAIVEPEYDDPIAKKWDRDVDRIRREQVDEWMVNVGYTLVDECDMFEGKNNPPGTGLPARWFVIYEPKH